MTNSNNPNTDPQFKGYLAIQAEQQRKLLESVVLSKNESKSIRQTFTAPRELARQHTRRKPNQGNLFDVLSPKAKEHAILASDKGRLFSDVVDGVNGNPMVSKVIIGLAQTLFEQSERKGNTDKLLGYTTELLELETEEAIPTKELVNDSSNNPVISPYACVCLRLSDFAKMVNGKHRIGGKEVINVREALTDLSRKLVYIDRGNGHYTGLPLCTIKGSHIDTNTNEEYLIVELSPLFTREIATDFVTCRKDTLKVLSGRQKDITFRLYWYLLEWHSYKTTPTYPLHKVTKYDLFSRIAVNKWYEDHKKKREEDFQEAVGKMLDLRLITSFREEEGATGDTICVFFLNKNYTNEPVRELNHIEAPPRKRLGNR